MTFLIISCIVGVLMGAFTQRIVTGVVCFLISIVGLYLGLPVFQFGFMGLPVYITIIGAVALAVEGIVFLRDGEDMSKTKKTGWITGCVLAVIGFGFGMIILPFLTTSAIFHDKEYQQLIGEVKKGIFSTDTSPVDLAHTRRVDQAFASKIGDKRLGEDAGLGSRVDIGTMNIQKVGNQLYWVGPLVHSGFFKWWENRTGTPGYVMVSVTDERDVRLVREVNGKSLSIKYNSGALFGDDPERYLYRNGYWNAGLTDFTFEIDDQGNPFLVVTKYEKKVGYSGNDAVGVVVLDVQSGEIKEYGIEDAPAWIDRIQPEEIVTSQLNNWGKYVHNWWNSFTAKTDIIKTTPGMSLVYGEDGNSYWYTGMTSAGSDEGTVGFVLVNTRTKQTKLYLQAGATEKAAMESAEGSVQEKGYKATFPILYNISGLPTYFITLKDDAGLVKLCAWISVEDCNIVGIGQTTQEALTDFYRVNRSKGNAIAPIASVSKYESSGVIIRVSKEVTNGETMHYYMIDSHTNKLFSGSPSISPEMFITQVGDKVKIGFVDGGNSLVEITSFDNMGIDLQKTEKQAGVEKRFADVQKEKEKSRSVQNAESAWSDMSAEDKLELLKKK